MSSAGEAPKNAGAAFFDHARFRPTRATRGGTNSGQAAGRYLDGRWRPVEAEVPTGFLPAVWTIGESVRSRDQSDQPAAGPFVGPVRWSFVMPQMAPLANLQQAEVNDGIQILVLGRFLLVDFTWQRLVEQKADLPVPPGRWMPHTNGESLLFLQTTRQLNANALRSCQTPQCLTIVCLPSLTHQQATCTSLTHLRGLEAHSSDARLQVAVTQSMTWIRGFRRRRADSAFRRNPRAENTQKSDWSWGEFGEMCSKIMKHGVISMPIYIAPIELFQSRN